jgi:hypothetical protein
VQEKAGTPSSEGFDRSFCRLSQVSIMYDTPINIVQVKNYQNSTPREVR